MTDEHQTPSLGDESPPAVEIDPRFVEYRRTRSRDVRNELVVTHSPLADALAKRFARRGEPLEDLRQVAFVGLLKAVERFEPERGLQFSTFATPTILGELKRHFRDKGWAVRVPRRLQELHLELGRCVPALAQELRRPPTTSEIATKVGTTEESVLEAMEAASLYGLSSLDAPSNSDDDDMTPTSARLGTEDGELESVVDRVDIRELLAHLSPRERRIIYLRFFQGLTQSEVAAEVGISQMHVSRLLTQSLELLRTHRANEGRQDSGDLVLTGDPDEVSARQDDVQPAFET